MKKVICLVFMFFFYTAVVSAQDKAVALAIKIAQKMQDSLLLNDAIKSQIYDINMQLHYKKNSIRQQYAGKDSLPYYIQKIENSRDSLYHSVLSEEKYQLYRTKKRQLINNN